MSWLQFRIITPRDHVKRIEKALNHAGALSITLEDNADQPIFEPELGETPLWHETRVTGLFPADIDSNTVSDLIISHAKLSHSQTHWHVLEDKDWEREWMTHYHPIQCGDNFWICPSWTEPPDASAVNLQLDPGLAFGTGTHPTTFLCLQWLAQQDFHSKTVMDYGCGSGILGIAALLMGADSAIGVDIDPQALLASKENANRNNVAPNRFPVFFPSKCPTELCNILFANILAGPLVELAEQLIALIKPGGTICLSGVLASQQKPLEEAYANSIIFSEPTEKDGWICLTGTKKRS